MSEEEDSEVFSEPADELDTNESAFQAEEGDTSAESDVEEYDEWTGFSRSSEAGEDPVPSPVKLQEVAAVTSTPQPASKYIPPHLRKVAADVRTQSSESLVKLTKQLKGLLNRYDAYLLSLYIYIYAHGVSSLSEQNMASILDGVEETFRSYSRNGMCTAVYRKMSLTQLKHSRYDLHVNQPDSRWNLVTHHPLGILCRALRSFCSWPIPYDRR